MARPLAKQFGPRVNNPCKSLATELARLRPLCQQQRADIVALQAQLQQWKEWAKEYRTATAEAYAEATAAAEQRRQVEQLLYQILNLINYGDRGAATALQQIQTLCNDYLGDS